MQQTTLCVPLDVKPDSCARLTALVDALKVREDHGAGPAMPNFDRIAQSVPALHFMSMSVFPGNAFDPLFVLEANFDGPPGVFWGQMEALLGPDLRAIIRCCKRPLDGDKLLYDAVTMSTASPAVAYLEARTQMPSVFFHGNRGLTRDQIIEGHTLFMAVQDEINDPVRAVPNPYRTGGPASVHQRLRQAMLPRFPGLGTAAARRISLADHMLDYVRVIGFLVLILLALSLPGVMLAAAMPVQVYLATVVVLAAVTIGLVWRNRLAITGMEVTTGTKIKLLGPLRLALLALAVALYTVITVVILAPGVMFLTYLLVVVAHTGYVSPRDVLVGTAWLVGLGLVSIAATGPFLLLMLRYNELRDSSQDQPTPDPLLLRDIVRREDWIMQNHMGSIVHIKPGMLRAAIIRAGHSGLGLFLRATATDGYLGSMRTVHYAHWAFLNNTSRLIFLSNFDHSWDSYLDDFIEKSHAGLTLSWGCGVGFPPTRLLVFDGASHGRQFKAWALASRTASRFWYSAYRDLTVDQIEREYRISTGLRRLSMTDQEATAWAWDL